MANLYALRGDGFFTHANSSTFADAFRSYNHTVQASGATDFNLLMGITPGGTSSSYYAKQDLVVDGTSLFTVHWEYGSTEGFIPAVVPHQVNKSANFIIKSRIAQSTANTNYKASICGNGSAGWVKITNTQYGSSTANATRSSSTFADKATLTFTPGSLDDYLIVAFCYLYNSSTSSGQPQARLDIDGTVYNNADTRGTGSSEYIPVGWMKRHSLSAASHTIKIQYASGDNFWTIGIGQARIMAIPLTGYTNYYNEGSNGTTSASWTNIASVTTVDGDKIYLILASVESTATSQYRLNVDGVYYYGTTVVVPSSGRIATSWILPVKVASGSNKTIALQGYNSTHTNPRIAIIDVQTDIQELKVETTARVSAAADDAEANVTGSTFSTSASMEKVGKDASANRYDTAIRFTNVDVKQGATIDNASVYVAGYSRTGSAFNWVVEGFDEDNAATFSTWANYSGRARTTATVNWAYGTVTMWSRIQSSELSTIVQEITDRASFAQFNAIAFNFQGVNAATNNYYSTLGYDDSVLYVSDLRVEWKETLASTARGTVAVLPTLENAGAKSTVAVYTDLADSFHRSQTAILTTLDKRATGGQVAIQTTLENPMYYPQMITPVQGGWNVTSASWSSIPSVFLFTAADYDGEVTARISGALKTNSATAGREAYAALWDKNTATVDTNTQITSSSTNYENKRSTTEVSLIDGHEYGFAMKNGNASYQTAVFGLHVLIKVRSKINPSKITTYIPIGMTNNATSFTAYTKIVDAPVIVWDAAAFDGTVVTYFEANIDTSGTTSSDITYARLYDKTAGAAVSGSEVSCLGTEGEVRKRSGAITLVDGHEYYVQYAQAVSGDTAYLRCAQIIVQQTASAGVAPTKYQLHRVVNVGIASGTNTSYSGYYYVGLLWDKWNINTTLVSHVDYHEGVLYSAGGSATAYTQLYDVPSTTAISSSEVTATATSDTNRVRSSAINIDTPLADGDFLGIQSKTSSASYAFNWKSVRVVSNMSLTGQLKSATAVYTDLQVADYRSATAVLVTLETNGIKSRLAVLSTLEVIPQKSTAAILTTLSKPAKSTVAIYSLLEAYKKSTTAILATLEKYAIKSTLAVYSILEKYALKSTAAVLAILEKYPQKSTAAVYTILEQKPTKSRVATLTTLEKPAKSTVAVLATLEKSPVKNTLAILTTLSKPGQSTVAIFTDCVRPFGYSQTAVLTTIEAYKKSTTAILATLEKRIPSSTAVLTTLEKSPVKSTLATLTTLETNAVKKTLAMFVDLERAQRSTTAIYTLIEANKRVAAAVLTTLEKSPVKSVLAIKVTLEPPPQKSTTAILTTLQTAVIKSRLAILSTLEKPGKSTTAILTTLSKPGKSVAAAILTTLDANRRSPTAVLTILEKAAQKSRVAILTSLEANIRRTLAVYAILEKYAIKSRVAIYTILEKFAQRSTVAVYTLIEANKRSTVAILTTLQSAAQRRTLAIYTLIEANIRRTLAIYTILEKTAQRSTVALRTTLETASKYSPIGLLATLEKAPQRSTTAIFTILEKPVKSTTAIYTELEAVKISTVAIYTTFEVIPQISTAAIKTDLESVKKSTVAIYTILKSSTGTPVSSKTVLKPSRQKTVLPRPKSNTYLRPNTAKTVLKPTSSNVILRSRR